MVQTKELDRINVDDIIPITSSQEGMLFHYIFEDDRNLYCEQLHIRLSGHIDDECFQKAWLNVIQCNEVLRSVFRWEGLERPVQIILREKDIKIDILDHRQASVSDIMANGNQIDLEHNPFMIVLIKGEQENESDLLLTSHHILFDGWSNSIILNEFFTSYHCLIAGKPLPVFNKPKFRSYIKWLSKQNKHKQLVYWDKYLKGFEKRTEIAINKQKKAIYEKAKEHVKTIDFIIGEGSQLLENIRKILLKGNWTLSALFYTAWGLILQKYNDTDDVVFGTAVSGRPETIAQVERIVGMFINTIPIRINYNSDKTIRNVLDETSRCIVERKEMETTPLVEINTAAGYSYGGLFDSIVVIDNYPISDDLLTNGALRVKSFEINEKTNYAAVLQVILAGGYQVKLHYYESDISQEAAERTLLHFMQVLSEISHSVEIKITDLQIITDKEKEDLIKTNDIVKYCDTTLHKLFEVTAEHIPNNVAVHFQDDCLTYQELNDRVNRFANAMKREGVESMQMVGHALPRSIDAIAVMLAILKIGAVCVPLDISHPIYRSQFIMRDSGMRMLVTSRDTGIEFAGKRLFIEDLGSEEALNDNQNDLVKPYDKAFLIYTSGTTGNPKGALLHHGGIINHCLAKADILDIKSCDRICNNFSLNFVAAIWQIFTPLIIGAELVIHSEAVEKDPTEQFIRASRDDITILQVIPSTLSAYIDGLKQRQPIPMPKLCRLALTAEEVRPYLVDKFYSYYNIPLVNCYGQTECCDDTLHYMLPIKNKTDVVPIGFPARNTHVYILDRHMNLQPKGIIGELCISGDGVINGYFNNQSLTDKKFIQNQYEYGVMYRTGDLAKLGEDGVVHYAGRVDHQVKIRGNRVELTEIENYFMNIPGMRAVSILPRGEDANKTLCAYFVTEKIQTVNEIRGYLLEFLPSYAVPSHYVVIDEMPMTPSGKIDKKKLHRLESNVAVGSTYEAPSDTVEREVMRIWAKNLEREDIGINDNFFDFGGHSLLLAKVMDSINEEFGCGLNITEMFQLNTIALIAKRIKNTDTGFADDDSYSEEFTNSYKQDGGIAIIGMAGRFPKANGIEAFWENVINGRVCLSFFDKFESSGSKGEVRVGAWGALDNVDMLDAEFFGISPREAEIADPQQRIFLECAWEALENAGYSNEKYAKSTGVFAGAGISTYMLKNLQSNEHVVKAMGKFQISIGNDKDYIATQTAYRLGLSGPAVTVQTACSTSLTAIHQACRALEGNECDLALAGGAHIAIPQDEGYIYEEGSNLSPDGLCRTFDDDAQGTAMGNGVGVVILKRYAEALRDGDSIVAVIKGSAINNDGRGKVGFTAPGIDGQAAVIRMAQEKAGIHPEDIGYVEAHGTATRLGDPIEIAALAKAFSKATAKRGYCAIGSLKPSTGHLDVAAGVASLIKSALTVKTGIIPPLPHFMLPNSEISFEETPFYVNKDLSYWDSRDGKRAAGVSSFGIGGTNVHVVLEKAETPKPYTSGRLKPCLLMFSAKTAAALVEYAKRFYNYIKENPDIPLDDICFTLQCGRMSFPYRTGLVCESREEAMAFLRSVQGLKHKPVPSDGAVKVISDRECDLSELATKWLAGHDVDFEPYHEGTMRRRIPLPTYPFQRTRYWISEARPSVDSRTDYKETIMEPIKEPEDEWYYTPVWRRSHTYDLLDGSQCFDRNLLIFCDESGVGEALAKRVNAGPGAVVAVMKGVAFNKHSPFIYSINPSSKDDYMRLISNLREDNIHIKTIAHLWNIDVAPAAGTREDIFLAEQYNGFFSLLFLAKALSKHFSHETELWAISRYTSRVCQGDSILPDKSTAIGICKVIRQEIPNIFSHSIDLDCGGKDWLNKTIDCLLVEMEQNGDELAVAYRNGERWIQLMEPIVPKPLRGGASFINNGVYILTGGLGRIGRVLVRKILSGTNAVIVLIGRNTLPHEDEWEEHMSGNGEYTEKLAALCEMREFARLTNTGSKITYFNADVCEKKDIEKIFDEVYSMYGRIDGVMHLAGITGQEAVNSIDELDVEGALMQFMPKTKGLINIAEISSAYGVGFLVAVSSLCAIMGGLGSAAYASANAFMDSYAQNAHYPLISVNWEAWKSEGHAKWLALDQYAITDEEGERILDRIVYMRIPQVIVSSGPLNTRIRRWTVRQKKNVSTQAIRNRRRELGNSSSMPSSATERLIAHIWEEMLGIGSIGTEDNFFELGGHSLIATRIVAQIRDIFKVDFTFRHFFDRPTIGGVYEILMQMPLLEAAADKIAEVYLSVDGLSDDEVSMLLDSQVYPQ